MRAKTHGFKGITYTEVPLDVVKALGIQPGDDLEFSIITGNVAAVYPVKTGNAQTAPQTEHLDLLRKINNVMSYERTRETLKAKLSPDEYKTFEKLLADKILFSYTKEGRPLIGISKEYFPLLSASPYVPHPDLMIFWDRGYLVTEDEGIVQSLTEELRRTKREHMVKGVRGFDRKYYVITRDKMSQLELDILGQADGRKTISQIAVNLKLEEPLLKACFEVLKEEGKVIEKRKETYQVA